MSAIKIFYNYNKIDKQHEYCVISDEKWAWFQMGLDIRKEELNLFNIHPYKIDGSKLIKSFASINSIEKIIPAIRQHYAGVKPGAN